MATSDADSRALLALGRRAATAAGRLVAQTPAHSVRACTKSSPTDFVTEMDRASES
jgi:fructose-1,6-bisphosphatase/inositol monophosphatase family enzyme